MTDGPSGGSAGPALIVVSGRRNAQPLIWQAR
jgi:hypothetical protein